MPITEQQQKFADEYLRTGNLTKAAKLAGYAEDFAGQIGWRLKSHPDISAYLEEGFKRKALAAGDVIGRIADIASIDLSDCIDHRGKLDMAKVKELGLDRFINEIGYDSNGELKVKFDDRQAALRDLGRFHKLFGDSNTISGPGGGPAVVEVRFVDELPALNDPVDGVVGEDAGGEDE